MDITRRLAANIVRTNFDSLDKGTIEKAKWRFIDTLGCTIGGARAAGCGMMQNLVKQWGGASESTIVAYGGKAPAHHAAMMNSLMARSFDFDPVNAEGESESSPAHISGTTVPTAMAVAEWQGASGLDLVTALVLGDDLAARLATASGFDPELGWDNTGTVNVFGATAAAGKLLGLNEEQMHNAFGIALNQLAGTMDGVFDKTMAFKLPIALAARNGIFSAELAKQGFTGVEDPLFGQHGYFALYCRSHNSQNICRDLGTKFYSSSVFKPYSSCRVTHPYIDSALKLAKQMDIDSEDVEEIIVHGSPATLNGFLGQPLVINDTPQVNAAFNLRYTIACGLLNKEVTPAYFELQSIQDPRIKILMAAIKTESDAGHGKSPSAEMQIRLKDGSTHSASTDVARGDIYRNPLTAQEIEAKFKANVFYSKMVSAEDAERALVMMKRLEELDHLNELAQLLTAANPSR